MTSATLSAGRKARRDRTPAQWYCFAFGATLLLVGLLGFIASADFGLGGDEQLNGDSFLGFEVNGWHNVVHIASGLLLLAAANTAPTAKTVAVTFGVVYGLVALWGIIDGDDVIGIIPVNTADNLLHIVIATLGVVAGMNSKTFRNKPHLPGRSRTPEPLSSERDAAVPPPVVANGAPGETGSERTTL